LFFAYVLEENQLIFAYVLESKPHKKQYASQLEDIQIGWHFCVCDMIICGGGQSERQMTMKRLSEP
jgi:hypothetical protein